MDGFDKAFDAMWDGDAIPNEEELTDSTETETPEPDSETEHEEQDLPDETEAPDDSDESEGAEEEAAPEPQAEEAPSPQPIVLKHNGQDIPIADMATVIALAQKGLDYGQKTQEIKPLRELAAHLQEHPEDWAKVKAAIEAKEQEQPEPQPKSTKPEWQDDESQEDYLVRLAEWKARDTLAEQERAERQLHAEAQQVIGSILKDPLQNATKALIFEDLRQGRLSQEAYSKADSDPNALRGLYAYYRRMAEGIISHLPAQPAQASAPAQTQSDPQITPRKKVNVPQTEKSRKHMTQRRSLSAGTIEDMGNEDFQQLVERVKRGEKVKIE
jgi:hypothetical protein